MSSLSRQLVCIYVYEGKRLSFHLLVPTLKWSVCQRGFGNRDALAFSSRNPSYEFIPDFAMDGVANAIHGHGNV